MRKQIFPGGIMNMSISRIAAVLILVFISWSFLPSISNAEIYGSISGQVTAESTGKGIPGVEVQAMQANKDNSISAITDINGLYILENVTPGEYLVGFRVEDSLYVSDNEPHIKVNVPLGHNVVNVNYVMREGGGIEGAIYAADGISPLSGQIVSAVCTGDFQEWIENKKRARTDSSGKYVIRGLPPSQSCTVSVSPIGMSIYSIEISISQGNITRNVNLIVKPDANTGIEGNVFVNSNPSKNALIVVRLGSQKIGEALTDENGYFSIVGLPPGTYSATAFLTSGEYKKITEILVELGRFTAVRFDFEGLLESKKKQLTSCFLAVCNS